MDKVYSGRSKGKPHSVPSSPTVEVLKDRDSPLSPDSTSGSVLEYREVTAAAYTIRKGVKETPLEVSVS